jgi:hypothetical protein
MAFPLIPAIMAAIKGVGGAAAGGATATAGKTAASVPSRGVITQSIKGGGTAPNKTDAIGKILNMFTKTDGETATNQGSDDGVSINPGLVGPGGQAIGGGGKPVKAAGGNNQYTPFAELALRMTT